MTEGVGHSMLDAPCEHYPDQLARFECRACTPPESLCRVCGFLPASRLRFVFIPFERVRVCDDCFAIYQRGAAGRAWVRLWRGVMRRFES